MGKRNMNDIDMYVGFNMEKYFFYWCEWLNFISVEWMYSVVRVDSIGGWNCNFWRNGEY